MPSELNPDIVINIDGTDRLADCKRFRIVNAGILKIPTAEIVLSNRDGFYTQGANKINLHDTVYIDADVRGVTDRIFYGTVSTPSCKMFRPSPVVPSDLVISCKASGQKTLWERKKKDYFDEGWLCKAAIEHMLANPDSGEDTGITLETDDGAILTTLFPINMDKDTLLTGIRAVAEEINYGGYWKGATWKTLFFKAVGTEACNPAISLAHPFFPIEPKFSIEDIKNYILVFGSADQGYPPKDLWTEYPLTRYDPDAWSAIDANVAMSEDASRVYAGVNSLKLVRQTSNGVIGAELDLTKTEYKQPQDPTKKGMHLNDDRFSEFLAYLYLYNFASIDPRIVLKDNANKEAKILLNAVLSGAWIERKISVLAHDHSLWTVDGGFAWAFVEKLRISHGLDTDNDGTVTVGTELNLDGLRMVGSGWLVDPLKYPTHNPPVKDDASIELYDRRVDPHDDESIKCFEHTQSIGRRLLSINKNPFERIKATKGAKTWAKPSQHLALTLPQYAISSEDWRIIEIVFDWTTKTKLLRSSMNLVPKLYGLPTSTARMESRGGLLAELIEGR